MLGNIGTIQMLYISTLRLEATQSSEMVITAYYSACPELNEHNLSLTGKRTSKIKFHQNLATYSDRRENSHAS
jgi:hypothetical protein